MDPRDDEAIFRSIVEAIFRKNLSYRKIKLSTNNIQDGIERRTKKTNRKSVTFADKKTQHKRVHFYEEGGSNN